MRYGHSTGGIIGITLKQNTLKIWALSRHICCRMESQMLEMEKEMESSKVQLHHKEEGKARIEANTKDRDGLRSRLDSFIDPLDPKQHPDRSTVNIVSGKIIPAFVNTKNSVLIGEGMMEDYEKT